MNYRLRVRVSISVHRLETGRMKEDKRINERKRKDEKTRDTEQGTKRRKRVNFPACFRKSFPLSFKNEAYFQGVFRAVAKGGEGRGGDNLGRIWEKTIAVKEERKRKGRRSSSAPVRNIAPNRKRKLPRLVWPSVQVRHSRDLLCV